MDKQKQLNLITIILLGIIFLVGRPSYAENPASLVGKTPTVARQTVNKEESDIFAKLNAPEDKAKDEDIKTSPALLAVSLLVKLIFVLAIAYGCIYLLKRYSNLKTSIIDNKKNIKILEHTSIGTGRNLHLVSIGGRNLLLGSTPQNISILAEIDSDQLTEMLEEQPAGFKEQLSQFMGQSEKKEEAAKSVAEMLRESTSSLRDTVSQVNKLRGDIRNRSDE